MTIENSIEWSWGGWEGYTIHPMAFRAPAWNMEYCRDGRLRPQVCDTTVSHLAYEPYYEGEKIPVIDPWEAW